jgi:hypothetical protein
MIRSRSVARLDAFRFAPRVEMRSRDGEIATIFPLETCRKFGGRRVRVRRRIVYREDAPVVILVWKGRGTINERRVRAGEEFFVCHATARAGLEMRAAADMPLEAFVFFPGARLH